MFIIFLLIIIILIALGPPTLALILLWYATRLENTIENMPGPFALPVVGNLLNIGLTPQATLKNLLRISKKYGNIFKLYIGNDVRVFARDPKHILDFLNRYEDISYRTAYKMLKPWIKEGLLTNTGYNWPSRRRLILPIFNFWRLEFYMRTFNACGDLFLQNLAKQKENVEIVPLVQLLTLDILNEAIMIKKLNAQKGENLEFAQALQRLLQIVMDRTCSCWKRIDCLFKFSSDYVKYNEALEILQKYTKKIIAKSRKRCNADDYDTYNSKNWNFIDKLLEAEKMGIIDANDVEDEVNSMMLTGQDAASATISFAMLSLAENPDIQEKVYYELISIDGPGTNTNLTLTSILKLKYLERVIEESIRYYPTVPIIERMVNKDATIGRYNIPEKTIVTILICALNQDPSVFPEPHKFDPDRFLPENKPENISDFTFGAGPRNCLGQRFGWYEVKAIIAKVVKYFRILPVPGFKPDLGIAAARLKSYNGIWLKFEKRF